MMNSSAANADSQGGDSMAGTSLAFQVFNAKKNSAHRKTAAELELKKEIESMEQNERLVEALQGSINGIRNKMQVRHQYNETILATMNSIRSSFAKIHSDLQNDKAIVRSCTAQKANVHDLLREIQQSVGRSESKLKNSVQDGQFYIKSLEKRIAFEEGEYLMKAEALDRETVNAEKVEKQLKDEIVQAESVIEKLSDEKKVLEEEKKELEVKEAEVNSVIEKRQVEKEEGEKMLRSLLFKFEEEQKCLNDEIGKQRERICQDEQKLMHQNDEIKKVENINYGLVRDIENHERCINNLQQEDGRLKAAMEEHIEKSSRIKEEQENELKQLDEKVLKTETLIGENKEALANLQQKMITLSEREVCLKTDITNLDSEQLAADIKNKETTNQLQAALLAIREAESKIALSTEKIELVKAETTAFESEIDAKLASLKIEKQTMDAKKLDRAAHFKRTLDELQASLDRIRKENAETTERNAASRTAQIDKLGEEIKTGKEVKNELEGEVDTLNSKLSGIQKEHEILNERISALEDANNVERLELLRKRQQNQIFMRQRERQVASQPARFPTKHKQSADDEEMSDSSVEHYSLEQLLKIKQRKLVKKK